MFWSELSSTDHPRFSNNVLALLKGRDALLLELARYLASLLFSSLSSLSSLDFPEDVASPAAESPLFFRLSLESFLLDFPDTVEAFLESEAAEDAFLDSLPSPVGEVTSPAPAEEARWNKLGWYGWDSLLREDPKSEMWFAESLDPAYPEVDVEADLSFLRNGLVCCWRAAWAWAADCLSLWRSPAAMDEWGIVIRRNRDGDSTLWISIESGSAYFFIREK